MRSLKTFLVLILFVLVTTTFIFSEGSKVRVVASQANIRLKPDTQSTIVSKIPLGGILDVIKKEGNWYYVKLPPDEQGIVVTGYIHQSTVEEIIEEAEQTVKTEERVVEKKEEKALEVTSKPVEPQKELSKDTNPDYLKWKEDYYKAETDFKKWKKYVYVGMFTSLGGALASCLTPLLIKDGSLAPTIAGLAVGLGGTGLWLYAAGKRSSAAEKMELLMNEGKIKKYFTAQINPRARYYALTLNIAF